MGVEVWSKSTVEKSGETRRNEGHNTARTGEVVQLVIFTGDFAVSRKLRKLGLLKRKLRSLCNESIYVIFAAVLNAN